VRVVVNLTKINPGINQATLAEKLGMEPMALSRLLGPLEFFGHVERRNTGDGKVVYLA